MGIIGKCLFDDRHDKLAMLFENTVMPNTRITNNDE